MQLDIAPSTEAASHGADPQLDISCGDLATISPTISSKKLYYLFVLINDDYNTYYQRGQIKSGVFKTQWFVSF